MIPKYMLVIKYIDKLIQNQESLTMIPSERVLSLQLNISRMTVRKAIDILVSQGKLYRVSNVGSFISDQKHYKVFNTLTGFSEEIESAGSIPSSSILFFEQMEASITIAKKLNIPKSSKIYKLIRLRKKDHLPMVIQECYFPADLIFLDSKIIQNSIYKYIKNELNLTIESTIQEIKAVLLSKTYAKLLQMNKEQPTIYTELTGYLNNGRIFEFSKNYKNQDNYTLIIQAMNARASI